MWRHLVRMYNLVAADLKALPFELPGESQWLNESCLSPLKRSPLGLLCRVWALSKQIRQIPSFANSRTARVGQVGRQKQKLHLLFQTLSIWWPKTNVKNTSYLFEFRKRGELEDSSAPRLEEVDRSYKRKIMFCLVSSRWLICQADFFSENTWIVGQTWGWVLIMMSENWNILGAGIRTVLARRKSLMSKKTIWLFSWDASMRLEPLGSLDTCQSEVLGARQTFWTTSQVLNW